MMVRISFSMIALLLLLFSCKQHDMFEKEIRVIDSTKIVLQVKLNELKRAEQTIQAAGFSKFEVYSSFLKTNVNDTLTKQEATVVQQFINSGNTINKFVFTNPELIKQTELSITQLQKLAIDVREGSLPKNNIQAFFSSERSHADELIKVIEQNVKAFNVSLNNYRNSVLRTEEYIIKINNGALPSVVPDSNL